MIKPVPRPYIRRQLLVCTNKRDPSTGKPSCGMHGSIELRERLKAEIKARGLKREVLVTGTSCLDYCPAEGCTVAFYPEGEFAIVNITPEDEKALLEKLIEG
ncbi:MAG: (2Fe-2S) ferredoxin domain-containing protein [Myxococcota bacterium]